MTNAQYIISKIGFKPSNDNTIESALLDQGFTVLSTYDVVNMIAIKRAAIAVLYVLLSTADTVLSSAGETQSSIKYDRPSILKLIGVLESETGEITNRPQVIPIKPW